MLVNLYRDLGPWPLSAATCRVIPASQQGKPCHAEPQAEAVLTGVSGSASACDARPATAAAAACPSADAPSIARNAAQLSSDAVSEPASACNNRPATAIFTCRTAAAAPAAAETPAAETPSVAAEARLASSLSDSTAAGLLLPDAPRDMSAYTVCFADVVLPARVDGTDPAITMEKSLTQRMQNIAGLPTLHASTLEVLCISGLLTSTHDGEWWVTKDGDQQQIYERCVQWFADFVMAWKAKFAAGQTKPDTYKLASLQAHIPMICESSKPILLTFKPDAMLQ